MLASLLLLLFGVSGWSLLILYVSGAFDKRWKDHAVDKRPQDWIHWQESIVERARQLEEAAAESLESVRNSQPKPRERPGYVNGQPGVELTQRYLERLRSPHAEDSENPLSKKH